MIGIVLVSHGLLARGLKDAAEMIVGPQERLLTIEMQPGADLAGLRGEIEAAVASLGKDCPVLVLVDLLGGLPANASFPFAARGVPVICGVNLPMLLELLTQHESTPIEELTDFAIQAAREGVINLTQRNMENN